MVKLAKGIWQLYAAVMYGAWSFLDLWVDWLEIPEVMRREMSRDEAVRAQKVYLGTALVAWWILLNGWGFGPGDTVFDRFFWMVLSSPVALCVAYLAWVFGLAFLSCISVVLRMAALIPKGLGGWAYSHWIGRGTFPWR